MMPVVSNSLPPEPITPPVIVSADKTPISKAAVMFAMKMGIGKPPGRLATPNISNSRTAAPIPPPINTRIPSLSID